MASSSSWLHSRALSLLILSSPPGISLAALLSSHILRDILDPSLRSVGLPSLVLAASALVLLTTSYVATPEHLPLHLRISPSVIMAHPSHLLGSSFDLNIPLRNLIYFSHRYSLACFFMFASYTCFFFFLNHPHISTFFDISGFFPLCGWLMGSGFFSCFNVLACGISA